MANSAAAFLCVFDEQFPNHSSETKRRHALEGLKSLLQQAPASITCEELRRITRLDANYSFWDCPDANPFEKYVRIDCSHVHALARSELELRARKLRAYEEGEYSPAANPERLDLAATAKFAGRSALAIRLYAEAFDLDPTLGEVGCHREIAACLAASLARGKVDTKEGVRLLQQALAWLRADLPRWTKRVQSGQAAWLALARSTFRDWQLPNHPLACLRDPDALEKLPVDEQAACQQLWSDVAILLQKASETKK